MSVEAEPAERQRTVAAQLLVLIEEGVDRLPLPGRGQTLERWRRLAQVAQHDLSLAKLFEGHTDALAIMQELGCPVRGSGPWATWCAEPPQARLCFSDPDREGGLRIQGRKAWCSGASAVEHAVVSGWNAAGAPCLATVALRQDAVRITDSGWSAVGMAATRSFDVEFVDAEGHAVGGPNAYVERPGFWHGGAGIAACWWGGAHAIAQVVHASLSGRSGPDAHQQAHLGSIDVALRASAALLREAATWIDLHPDSDARAWALRVRLAVEREATSVIWHAGRALGAGPLCKDARFARAMADLPVFMRQSHAERDLAALGQHVGEDAMQWTL